jgi:Ser/Thr protein kinase RdoA (MazF antagonist)
VSHVVPAGEHLERMRRLATLALPAWDIRVVAIEPIKIRENAVFRVDKDDGGRVILRIHRSGYHTDDALWSEFQWLQSLTAQGVEVPRAILSTAGRYFEVVDLPGQLDPRQVDVLEWINGQRLETSEPDIAGDCLVLTDRCRELGELTARLHDHATQWKLPRGFIRHSWDADGLVGDYPIWGRFWELPWLTATQKALVTRARGAVRQDLLAYGKQRGDYSLIHADLNPENVLVDTNCLRIIDFDDSGFGWHLFDIATILYFIRGKNYFCSASDALLEGYRSRRSLTHEQWSKLPLFTAARAMTYLGWIYTRQDSDLVRSKSLQLIEDACGAVDDYLRDSHFS